jgi:intraflagellar transport protein 56
MLHMAQKAGDEKTLMAYHEKLKDSSIPDQLCLAALHYLRGHYEDATEIYKKILMDKRQYSALNVYMALCYYKLDYYDVSLDLLSLYLASEPTSIIGVNLRACNNYQLYNGKTAEDELRTLEKVPHSGNLFQDNDLLRHNLVVLRNGENAMQTLPPLVDVVPEGKLNLVIYHLKNQEIEEAFNLMKDVEPTTPKEYILKAVVHAVVGQQTEAKEHLKIAQQLFQLVGGSASECDTIPGRQCMASCFFLLRQFEDVLVYLKSIRDFFPNDDDFNWNYGIALAAAGDYKTAEEALQLIKNEAYKSEYTFMSWLCKCYIVNGKPAYSLPRSHLLALPGTCT